MTLLSRISIVSSGMSSAVGPWRMFSGSVQHARVIRTLWLFLRTPRSLSRAVLAITLVAAATFAAVAKDHDESDAGLSVEVPESEADVALAVAGVSEDQIIHGTYVYEKDKILTGAQEAHESSVFHDGPISGKVFYKVANNVIAPRNFKASKDVGTITVRYIVQSSGPTSSALQIDAVFIESSGHGVHRSEGAVELAEYDAIKSHLKASQASRKREHDEILRLQQEDAERRALAEWRKEQAQEATAKTEATVKELQQKIADLKQQVEGMVKAPGVALKSAPFRSAATLQSLPAKTEVLIVIVTQYWYGVETRDGRHGWILRTELEPLP